MQSPQACHLLYDRRPGETYMDSQLLTCRQIASIKSWTLVTVCQVYRRALVTVGQVYKQAQRSRRMTSLRFSAVLLTLTWSLGLSLPFQHVSAVHHVHLVFFFYKQSILYVPLERYSRCILFTSHQCYGSKSEGSISFSQIRNFFLLIRMHTQIS